jgi:hypothetical protein
MAASIREEFPYAASCHPASIAATAEAGFALGMHSAVAQ